MLLFLPLNVDVPLSRWPISNFLLIGMILFISIAIWLGIIDPSTADQMVLDGWSPIGMVGSIFHHLDVVHLLGNLIFLWTFGNAVCAKVGNLLYIPLFVLFGVVGGAAHNIFIGGPAIGASDAINGVVAMFLFWYALNDVMCLWVLFFKGGMVRVSSYYIIGAFLIFDLYGVLTAGQGVAYVAHLGGFAAGFITSLTAWHLGWLEAGRYERDLPDVMGWDHLKPKINVDGDELAEENHLGPELMKLESNKVASPLSTTTQPQHVNETSVIRFRCGSCGQAIKVPRSATGKRGRCPQCGANVTVPKYIS